MSSRYKFELVSCNEDDKIGWELTHKTLGKWTGYIKIDTVTDQGKVVVDFHTDTPTNTPIPYRGEVMIAHHLRSLIRGAIYNALKTYYYN